MFRHSLPYILNFGLQGRVNILNEHRKTKIINILQNSVSTLFNLLNTGFYLFFKIILLSVECNLLNVVGRKPYGIISNTISFEFNFIKACPFNILYNVVVVL